MTVFSLVPFPEYLGIDLLDTIFLRGNVYDIEGNPVEMEIQIGLNSYAARYKTDFSLAGDPIAAVSSAADGSWGAELPDTSGMSPDSYYRITLNKRVLRKILEDFPLEQSLNELEDY